MKKAGRRLRTEHLEVRSIDSLLSYARAAVIVGKHGHTIVERNRLRRRLRELVRTVVLPTVAAKDLVVRTLPGAYKAGFDELRTEIEIVKNKLAEESV